MSSDSPTPAAPPRSVWQRPLREPLLQFLVLGLLIFVFAGWRARVNDETRSTITIDAGLISYLKNLYNVQYGFFPDAETLEFLINNHVREEVLLREAMKLGLAQDDEIIRRRLVQKMEYLVEDSKGEPAADETVLKAWYEAHTSNYQQAATASFSQLYFSTDNSSDAAAQARAQAVLASAGKRELTSSMGDGFPLDSDFRNLDEAAVRQLLGESPLQAAVFSVTPGVWTGPFRSGFGWHLLKVEARTDAQVQPYEKVAAQVLADWQQATRQQRADAQLKKLIDRYRVVRQQ